MLAEVAPFLFPQFDALLVSLLYIAGCLAALGIIAVLHSFSRAIFGGFSNIVGAIPGVGGILTSPANAVWHWMDHEFGAAEQSLDGILARYFQSLGQLVKWVADEIAAHADMLYTLATVMAGPATVLYLENLIAHAGRRLGQAEQTLELVGRRLHGAELAIQHAATGSIGAAIRVLTFPIDEEIHSLRGWVWPRVRGLEHAVGQTIPYEVEGLRAAARSIEDAQQVAFHRIARLERATSVEALTAVVAVAAAELGFEWVRCRSWRRIGRGVCGTPGRLLEALFTGAIEAFLVTDICQIAGLIEAEAVAFEPLLQEFVNAQRFICLSGGAHYAKGITGADLRSDGGHPTAIVAADLAA